MGKEKIDNDFTNAKYKKGEVVWFDNDGTPISGKIIYHYKDSYGVEVTTKNNRKIIYQIKEEDIMSEPEVKYGNTTAIGAKDPREPEYYKMAITPIDFILANNLGFCESNCIKYLCRYENKNGKEDLLKALKYLDILIQHKYPD